MFCFANAAIGRLTGVKLLPFRGFAKPNSLNQSAIQENTSNYKWGASGSTSFGGKYSEIRHTLPLHAESVPPFVTEGTSEASTPGDRAHTPHAP